MNKPATIACQKEKFYLPADVSYLNCAYMSPLMKSVEEAGIAGLRLKRTPYQIGHHEFFDAVDLLRQEFARLIHVPDPKRIVVIPSVSYGMATVAKNLKLTKGDNIIVAGEQFPSNVYTWQKLTAQSKAVLTTISGPEEEKQRGKIWNERILEAIDTHTRLVSLAHVHWSDGTKFDLPAIRQRTREVGALLVVDGTQSVGALPFDAQQIQPDALICTAYKWLMGPYAIGLAYLGEYFDGGDPLEEGWINRYESENFANLVNYQPQYQPQALRYEVGERSNFILVPMLLQAIRELNQWGVENIQDYCRSLSEPAIEALSKSGYIIEHRDYRGSHLFGIRLPPNKTIETLQQRLLEHQVMVSVRGKSVRVSPHLYNNMQDIEKLLQCFLL